jgi:hypothetical protein
VGIGICIRDDKGSYFVLVSLAQLVWTMHKICKVWGSNLGHHQKKKRKLLPPVSNVRNKNKIGGLKYKKKYSKMNILNATIPSLPSLNPPR